MDTVFDGKLWTSELLSDFDGKLWTYELLSIWSRW